MESRFLNDYFVTSKVVIPEKFDLYSKCSCKKDRIEVVKLPQGFNIIIYENISIKKFDYNITIKQFESLKLTCDLFKVLRRGPNQKVISFSLYGKEKYYYDKLEFNVKSSKLLYPSWVSRIYHDNTIDKSVICKIECLKEGNNLYDNVDFCDVSKLSSNLLEQIDATYMLPMSWRWLPIGDSFVDCFVSRDTDSCIFERELVAVNEWLNSSTLFHIMRDHPSHGPKILGGMWGFYNKLDKNLSRYFFDIITSKLVSYWYRAYMLKRQPDQFMLEYYFWPIAKKNSTIHDSYHCKKLGGQPFKTKRLNYSGCHVGALSCCGPEYDKNLFLHVCPEECRFKKEWIYC